MVLTMAILREYCLKNGLGSTDDNVLGYDEDIKLGSTHGKLIVTILVNVYLITLGIDVGKDLG